MPKKANTKEKNSPKLASAPVFRRPSSMEIAIAQVTVEEFFKVRRRPVEKGGKITREYVGDYAENGKFTLAGLAASGMLRRENGEYYEFSDTNSSVYIEMAKDIAAGKSIYLTDPVTGQSRCFTREGQNKIMSRKPVDPALAFADGHFKAACMENLRTIRDELVATGVKSSESQSFARLREGLNEKLQALDKTPFQKDFEEALRDISRLSEKYRIEKIGQRLNDTRSRRVHAVERLSQLTEAALLGKYPDELEKTEEEKLRQQLAEKFVKSYAIRRGKLRNDPQAKAESEKLLSDVDAFKKKAEETLQEPYFKELFDTENPSAEIRIQEMNKLREAAAKSPSDVFKQVRQEEKKYELRMKEELERQERAEKEAREAHPGQPQEGAIEGQPEQPQAQTEQQPLPVEEPKNDEVQAQQPQAEEQQPQAEEQQPQAEEPRVQEKEKAVPLLRADSYDKNRKYTEEQIKDFTDTVKDLQADLKRIKKAGRTSAQFKQLDRAVNIAIIRMNRGNNFIDYGRMAAELGDAADRYFNFKLKDPANDRAFGRMEVAAKLRHVADAMNEGKLPSESIPGKHSLHTEIVQAKIVSFQAQKLQESKDPREQKIGREINRNRDTFRKKMDEVGKSPAFEQYFGAMSPSELEKNAREVPKVISEAMAKKAAKALGKRPAPKAPARQAENPQRAPEQHSLPGM